MASQDSLLFYHSIQAILKSWTALQLAVSHSFAGPHSNEKAQWFVGVVDTFFKENKNLDPFELEEFLDSVLMNEFNTIPEDNSSREISLDICKMYKLWENGKYDEIRKRLSSLPCVNLGQCVSTNISIDETMQDLNEQEDMLNQLKICKPNIPVSISEGDISKESTSHFQNSDHDKEDGWTHVTRKRRQK